MIAYKLSSFLWSLLLLFLFPLSCCGLLSYSQYSPQSGPTIPQQSARFVQVPLLSYLNNKGIGNSPGQGNFDGSGFAFPAGQLPSVGLSVLNEVPYQFPGSA